MTSGVAAVTAATTTGGSPTITITDKYTDIAFQFAVACSEKADDFSNERGFVNGVVFQVYTDAECKTAPAAWYDASGAAKTATTSEVTTAADSNMSPKDGVAHMLGLPIGTVAGSTKTPATYYVKLKTIPSGYDMIVPDTTSVFQLSVDEKGVTTVTKKSPTTTSNTSKMIADTLASNRVLARVYRGKFKFTTVDRNSTSTKLSGAKYTVYRIKDDNSAVGGGRSEYKMKGDKTGYSTSGESSATKYDSLSIVAKLMNRLNTFGDNLVLKAMASTASYASNSWESVTAVTSDSSGLVTFTGLVPGQNYLIMNSSAASGYTATDKPIIIKTSKKSSVTDPDDALMVTTILDFNGTSSSNTKAITISGSTVNWLETSSSAATTASSGASTAKSGSSTTTGSSTQSSGSGAGAGGRGAATGDDSRLWFHLIVMLIAFDALTADLLYITRKKKKARAK